MDANLSVCVYVRFRVLMYVYDKVVNSNQTTFLTTYLAEARE